MFFTESNMRTRFIADPKVKRIVINLLAKG